MPQCPRCDHHLAREHRSGVQRLLYRELFECKHCHFRMARPHAGISGTVGFLFARHSQCLKCGNARVQRLTKKDRIDTVSKHPLSVLLGLTGAPINRCPLCRIQYRDWRKPARPRDEMA